MKQFIFLLLTTSAFAEVKTETITVPMPVASSLRRMLRADICGSLFPLYDRNPNTGEGPFGAKTLVSNESVYHSPLKASRIVLPVKQ